MFYIYKITNLINNKIYVGLTTGTVEGRFKAHISDSRTSKSGIDAAIRKYGKDNFKVEIIDTSDNIENLNEKEIYWISKLDSTNNKIGYNQTLGGGGIKGYKHTPENKYLCGSSFRGKRRIKTSEQIEKWKKSYVGHKFSDDVKKKRSQQLKLAYAEGRRKPNGKGVGGRGPMTDEEKFLNSENQKGRRWMHNNSLRINLTIWKDEIEKFEDKGWKFKKNPEYKTIRRKDAKELGIL